MKTHRYLVSALSLVAITASPAAAVIYNTFTAPPSSGSVGFTFAGNKFVGSIAGNGPGLLYQTDLTGGSVQVFAPTVNLASSPSTEHYVAASYQIGGWIGGEIYAANGSSIVRISNNGATSNTFVSGLGGEVRGISFDLQGTFGNNMLVTTDAGNVYRITPGGVPTLVANVQVNNTSVQLEGLDIAPLGGGFATYDGQLFVASETANAIFAVSNGGVVTQLANGSLGPITINSAEELTFVPLNLGASGSPLEGLYSANYSPDVLFANGSQFAGMQGDMIVTGELTDKVMRVHWNGSQFVLTGEGSFPSANGSSPSPQPEDGLFITPQIIGLSTPEPSTFLMCAIGIAGFCWVSIRRYRGASR